MSAPGWWIPLVLAVVLPVVAWAAVVYRRPIPDPDADFAAWWEALGADIRAERGSIADDIADTATCLEEQ